jgi:hypothetical protein
MTGELEVQSPLPVLLTATRQTHPAFSPVDTRIFSSRVKQPSRKVDHLIPSITRVNNNWRPA